MKKILVPIDGSKYSMLAIEKALELGKALDSRIVLFYVIPVYPSAFPFEISEGLRVDLLKEAKANATKVLDTAKKKLAGYSKVDSILSEGIVADEIIHYADVNDVDLIVMGSQGIGAIHNILIGSVTRKVAVESTKPILIIK
jgi:nucleotide-binding universal stress UspA family protein